MALSAGWLAIISMVGHSNALGKLTTHTSNLDVVYFVAATISTIGYGDVVPTRSDTIALCFELFTICSGIIMLSIVMARAISLVPNLPKN